jgi:hypothetical protein
MLREVVAYSLFFETCFGFATIYWWWKRCDRVEKIFLILHLSGASLFAYTMLL